MWRVFTDTINKESMKHHIGAILTANRQLKVFLLSLVGFSGLFGREG